MRDAVSDFAHGSEEMLALYRLAVANASGAVWALDLKSRVVYQSAAIRHQLGYEAHELAGEFSQWTELLHPDDRALMATDGFFDSTKDESIEYRMQHKDGTYRWILGRVWVVRDAEGHAHSLFGTQLDITDRKRAETELAKSEERLSLVAQATGVAISDIDLLTQNVWCNDAFESMFGVAPAHASSADDWWLGHINPDDRARVATAYAKARASQNPLSEDSYRWRHNDDEDDITLVEMTHLGRDSKGTVVRVLKALVDVTERRRNESKLRYLANELNDSERRTRRDLARDLHDYLAQMLIACLLKIRALPRPSSGLPVLDEIEALIVDA
jgi:PAS domain S-box-containing protein